MNVEVINSSLSCCVIVPTCYRLYVNATILKDWDVIDKLSVECSIEVTGTIHKDDRAPTGYELRAGTLNVVGESHQYPITRDMSIEHLANNRTYGYVHVK